MTRAGVLSKAPGRPPRDVVRAALDFAYDSASGNALTGASDRLYVTARLADHWREGSERARATAGFARAGAWVSYDRRDQTSVGTQRTNL